MDKKKFNKRLVVAIALMVSLVVDLAFLILMLPKILKNKQDLLEYRLNEDSNTMYEGLIKYIDDEAKVLGLEEPTCLRSLQFEEETLKIMTLSDNDTPLYVEITTHKQSVDEALKEFLNSEVKYSISFQEDEWESDKPINIDKYVYDRRVAITTENNDVTYISFTAQYDKNHYCSLTRGVYKNDGDYVTTTIIGPEEDKYLCDFYYLIINN